jgi:hypothetical protein
MRAQQHQARLQKLQASANIDLGRLGRSVA